MNGATALALFVVFFLFAGGRRRRMPYRGPVEDNRALVSYFLGNHTQAEGSIVNFGDRTSHADKPGFARYVSSWASDFARVGFPTLYVADRHAATAVVVAWIATEGGWAFPSLNGARNPMNTTAHMIGDTGADVGGSPVYRSVAEGMAANLGTLLHERYQAARSLPTAEQTIGTIGPLWLDADDPATNAEYVASWESDFRDVYPTIAQLEIDP